MLDGHSYKFGRLKTIPFQSTELWTYIAVPYWNVHVEGRSLMRLIATKQMIKLLISRLPPMLLSPSFYFTFHDYISEVRKVTLLWVLPTLGKLYWGYPLLEQNTYHWHIYQVIVLLFKFHLHHCDCTIVTSEAKMSLVCVFLYQEYLVWQWNTFFFTKPLSNMLIFMIFNRFSIFCTTQGYLVDGELECPFKN